ncbi:twin-arginine translocation signal domain-containing protein [Haloarchaeobius sp. DYHT-AS-18]|uniref:twin-arginine translocation signal domain-containing protein n=1 Tax=Haloarchaeobius sp. DYHT-AS-18 TaxID=3446117 RepID=UPI003EBA2005
MTDENDPHCRHGQETKQNRANTTSESRVSRRDLLKGSGGAAAATVIPFEGLTTKANSPGGLNNRGAPVVVVQGTPNNPVGFKRRKNITDRVHEEAIDRGREPPRRKGGIKRADQKTNPTVAYVTTVTDDGVPRSYHALAKNDPGSAHGRAMARAKLLAEKNGSEIEVHKPNGRVDTMRPNGVGNARRVTPITNERLQKYAAELDISPSRREYDASRSNRQLTDMGNPFFHDVIEEDPDHTFGHAELYMDMYHETSGGTTDPYQVHTRFWQKCGKEIHGNDWGNNYAKVSHRWDKNYTGEDNLSVHELDEVRPEGGGDTVVQGESLSVSLDNIEWSTSLDQYYTGGLDIEEDKDRINEHVNWHVTYIDEDLRWGDKDNNLSSGAVLDANDCNVGTQWMLLSKNEAGFIEDEGTNYDEWHDKDDCALERDSIYMNYWHGISC